MAFADQARDRLHAAVEPILTLPNAPHPLRRAAADVSDAPDMLPAMEAMIPLILGLEDAAETLATMARTLRRHLAEVMDETGAATIRAETHTASVSAGRAGVVITDEALIPPTLMRQPPPAPDKTAIAKLLREGKAVPGAVLGNAGPSLTIRWRDK